MKNIINDACRHIPNAGSHVLEDHYDLLNAKGKTILKPLWEATLKPGDTIKMIMWPMQSHPVHFIRGIIPDPPLHGENDAARRRHARLARWPAGPPYPTPIMPPGGPMPFSGMRYPGMGGPPPRRVPVESIITSLASDKDDAMTWAEEKELTFVNYVEELEKEKELTVPKMLTKFTNLTDVNGAEIFEGDWGRNDHDYSDSGSSSFSGSGYLTDDD